MQVAILAEELLEVGERSRPQVHRQPLRAHHYHVAAHPR